MRASLPGLFVVGTDTGVGKTWVSCSIARSLVRRGRKVGVLKPLATGVHEGASPGEDASALLAAVAAGHDRPIRPDRVAPLVFSEPLAPVVAARLQGRRLEQVEVERACAEALEWWREERGAELMVVEGIGGLLTPLAEGTTLADLAIRLDYPLVVVARDALGTLNHTLLTIEAARRRGLRIAGVVLNASVPDETRGRSRATHAEELSRRLEPGLAVLAVLPYLDSPEAMDVRLHHLDWQERAQLPRGPAGIEELAHA